LSKILKVEANIRDYLLDIDDLNRPKVLDMENIQTGTMNSAALLIIRLLLLKKGSYPDFPDLGIDIRGRYRFAFEEELITLRNELEDQISTYLPELIPVDVEVSLYRPKDSLENMILFSIIIRQVKFEILYNVAANTIEGLNS
jgi:hypothetical protein